MNSNEKFKNKKFAICFSHICYGQKYPSKVTGGVRKSVSIFADFCPDCQHALFWTDYEGYQLAGEPKRQPKPESVRRQKQKEARKLKCQSLKQPSEK